MSFPIYPKIGLYLLTELLEKALANEPVATLHLDLLGELANPYLLDGSDDTLMCLPHHHTRATDKETHHHLAKGVAYTNAVLNSYHHQEKEYFLLLSFAYYNSHQKQKDIFGVTREAVGANSPYTLLVQQYKQAKPDQAININSVLMDLGQPLPNHNCLFDDGSKNRAIFHAKVRALGNVKIYQDTESTLTTQNGYTIKLALNATNTAFDDDVVNQRSIIVADTQSFVVWAEKADDIIIIGDLHTHSFMPSKLFAHDVAGQLDMVVIINAIKERLPKIKEYQELSKQIHRERLIPVETTHSNQFVVVTKDPVLTDDKWVGQALLATGESVAIVFDFEPCFLHLMVNPQGRLGLKTVT